MKNLTWQNPEQLFVAQELINKVKSKCCGIKVYYYCPRFYNTYIHRLHIHIPKPEENYYCFPCYFLFSHTFILRFLDFVVPILFLTSFRHSNQYRLSILHEQPIRFQEEYFVLFSSNTHSNLPFLQL